VCNAVQVQLSVRRITEILSDFGKSLGQLSDEPFVLSYCVKRRYTCIAPSDFKGKPDSCHL
jgi:hypothetical protein